MMIASRSIARPLRLAFLAVAPGSFCIAAPASADTRAGGSVSAGASTENNPYLVNGSGTDVALSAQIDPWLKWSDDISSLNASGNLSIRRYAKASNGTDINATASVSANRRMSEYVSVNTGVNYFTSRNGINVGFANVGAGDPPPPPNTPLPDISLGGTRTTTQSVNGNLGISVRVSPLDALGANVYAMRSFYGSAAGNDFTSISGGLNYSRTLSERLTANVSVSYNKSNYLNSRIGDGTVISPQAGISLRLSPLLSLSANLGVAIANSEIGTGTGTGIGSGFKLKSTSLSGNVSVCRSGERGSMCLNAARSTQPTAIGRIQSVTNVSFGYNSRLTAKDSINADLGYSSSSSNSSSALTLLAGPETSKFFTASGSWSHNFNRRFSAFISPSYARIVNSSNTYDSFRLSAGLRFSFGAPS